MITHVKTLPSEPRLEDFEREAEALLEACRANEAEALRRVKDSPHTSSLVYRDTINAGFDAAAARRVVALHYGFEWWPDLIAHIEALGRPDSPIAAFEAAADAIATGDAATLASRLREHPDLVRARSTREHRGTLLHYVGANGIEFYRQKSPPNAVVIATLLIDAGAELDAVANMYGWGTTLGLVATSAHPRLARVQVPLLAALLDAGANVDGPPESWNALTAACANGCGEAADFLASRGARLDLEGAAGVGRLDVVQTLFEHGRPRRDATARQARRGFSWACRFGKADVVDYLLRHEIDTASRIDGMHWAAAGGDLPTLRLFLDRGAPLEARGPWDGTMLETAVWCAEHNETGRDYRPLIAALIEAGADQDAEPDLRPRAAAALAGQPA
jgi:ankyrin repeat protein